MGKARASGGARPQTVVALVILGLLAGGVLLTGSGCYPKAQIYGVENVGGLIFAVNPPDAEVILDDVSQGKASEFTGERYLKVESGPHRLELQKAGYETYFRNIYVSNTLMRIEATLALSEAPLPGGR